MVINMRLPKKLLALLVAAMCAVLAAGGCNPQKTPDYGINPVALSVNGVDITLFDFDRFYTTNQNITTLPMVQLTLRSILKQFLMKSSATVLL